METTFDDDDEDDGRPLPLRVADAELDEVCRGAIDAWGQAAQVGVAVEELAELAAACQRFFGRGRGTVDDVAEEIADVEIVCCQLRALVGGRLVDRFKAMKVRRLRARLEEFPDPERLDSVDPVADKGPDRRSLADRLDELLDGVSLPFDEALAVVREACDRELRACEVVARRARKGDKR